MFADHKSTAWLRSNPTLKQDDSEQVAQANIQVAFQSLKDGKVPLPEQHSVIFTIKKKKFSVLQMESMFQFDTTMTQTWKEWLPHHRTVQPLTVCRNGPRKKTHEIQHNEI